MTAAKDWLDLAIAQADAHRPRSEARNLSIVTMRMDTAEALQRTVGELVETLRQIARTKPVLGLNPKAKVNAPDAVHWNVHALANAAIARYEGGAQ